jgi:hypothetical protein
LALIALRFSQVGQSTRRLVRIGAGLALIVVGSCSVAVGWPWPSSASGPLPPEFFDFCILGPLFRLPSRAGGSARSRPITEIAQGR